MHNADRGGRQLQVGIDFCDSWKSDLALLHSFDVDDRYDTANDERKLTHAGVL